MSERARGPATRNQHPSKASGAPRAPAKKKPASAGPTLQIPAGKDVRIDVQGRTLRLTNLDKPFWPELGVTKRDLLQYYADVAPALLPHLADRAMVMKRYPDGAAGEPFFMKRAPSPRPEWIETCSIAHASGNVIDFPMVQDLASLLWVVNLGCIDLNPWYARCDDVDRPDYLHFDLDPVPEATYAAVVETAQLVRTALVGLGMQPIVKTTGSRGLHVYVPIVHGPTQKDVWRFAKQFAVGMAALRPDVVTAEYRIAKRPAGRVLVDYNQNAWGRTLASAYSPRPRPRATVSAPITWAELDAGAQIDDFDIANMPARIAAVGDLWAPLLDPVQRFDFRRLLGASG
ncbi:non-homologous end-joining DNA ligase [Piscinibacter koreensis]|uniref:DNA polymerase domain-containing protein n=1 Tax=Piscinibacter koreensis TaxID=2742824 RepID=A0A7Y6TVH4_9BURK|nr:non-homologous end-joining DNA ligase [Schlegelella koreensis]NUZ05119.1 DNA polymerase domain-containing protein [Schlegelella koreensis]